MKVLVTGGAGYIGSHAVRQLTETGYNVTVIDNLSTGFKESFLHGENLIVGDIGNEKLLREIFAAGKFEAVLHFAGSIIVPESVRDPAKYYKNNTMNTLLLAEAAGAAGIETFIFSSTASVYGTNQAGLASEETPVVPCNPYGSSKLMSEKILEDLAKKHGFNLGILRYFNVSGADPEARIGQKTKNATHLIKICCQAALGIRPQVEIFGDDYETKDGTCVRDYIHVEDLALAHLMLIDHLTSHAGTLVLNAGYGVGHSVTEVVELTKTITGVDFKSVISRRREGDPAIVVSKADRIHKIINWKPQHASLEKIITDAWRWEQKWKNC